MSSFINAIFSLKWFMILFVKLIPRLILWRYLLWWRGCVIFIKHKLRFQLSLWYKRFDFFHLLCNISFHKLLQILLSWCRFNQRILSAYGWWWSWWSFWWDHVPTICCCWWSCCVRTSYNEIGIKSIFHLFLR